MKNIAYIHGWASCYDPDSDKIRILKECFNVSGITIDYAQDRDQTIQELFEFISDNDIDVIIGTSFGGYWAAILGNMTGIPFVSINPAVDPAKALVKYVGKGTTYYGKEYDLTQEIIQQFGGHVFPEYGNGMILLDQDDEVIDSNETKIKLSNYHPIMFEGGSHRFDHMRESIPLIKKFINHSIVDGLD